MDREKIFYKAETCEKCIWVFEEGNRDRPLFFKKGKDLEWATEG